MTVHMVRVQMEPPRGNAETAVGNWVENHPEWDDDPVDHALTETTTDWAQDPVAFVRGDYRFLQAGVDRTALLDDLEDRLQSFQGGLWYRIRWHSCDHDETDPGDCSWGEVRETDDVPAVIP